MPVVATARPLGQPAWVQIPPGSVLRGPGQVRDFPVSQLSHLETGDPRSAHFTVGGGMAEPTVPLRMHRPGPCPGPSPQEDATIHPYYLTRSS